MVCFQFLQPINKAGKGREVNVFCVNKNNRKSASQLASGRIRTYPRTSGCEVNAFDLHRRPEKTLRRSPRCWQCRALAYFSSGLSAGCSHYNGRQHLWAWCFLLYWLISIEGKSEKTLLVTVLLVFQLSSFLSPGSPLWVWPLLIFTEAIYQGYLTFSTYFFSQYQTKESIHTSWPDILQSSSIQPHCEAAWKAVVNNPAASFTKHQILGTSSGKCEGEPSHAEADSEGP